ncbi:MAG: RNHCP domain-containing protein [Clostridia bacterium]|nr:RNHCP domain-containing protein [Clostridia bacterium]
MLNMERKFSKNDNEFICKNCGKKVEKLGYTSRDHCNKCLCSVHIDINPGDRANDCLGTLVPVAVNPSSKKGYIITYKCDKCGKTHNNKTADDDSMKTILSVISGKYDRNNF